MVGFHPVNKPMTIGTFLFISSLIVLAIGSIFRSNGTVLAYSFLYGGLAFLISLVLLALGAILGVRSGRLQRRTSDILQNTRKKH